eukprot:scaffold16399_cov98-Cylindrotheca_fusiformis.AAC.1
MIRTVLEEFRCRTILVDESQWSPSLQLRHRQRNPKQQQTVAVEQEEEQLEEVEWRRDPWR